MKGWIDKHARDREFLPVDNVLVLLLISCLQACNSGPYLIHDEVGDYLVATPDRWQRNHLCHVNMLKTLLWQG